jgi:hypothetical protein
MLSYLSLNSAVSVRSCLSCAKSCYSVPSRGKRHIAKRKSQRSSKLNDISNYSAYVKITNVCSNILEPLPRNIIINFEAVVASFGFTALSACDSVMPQKSADLIGIAAEPLIHGKYIFVQVFQHVIYHFLRRMSLYPTNISVPSPQLM